MNSLPLTRALQSDSATRHRPMRAIFRFPKEMHIPLRAIAIHFDVMPTARWLRRSFRAWFSAPTLLEPAWMRDAKA